LQRKDTLSKNKKEKKVTPSKILPLPLGGGGLRRGREIITEPTKLVSNYRLNAK